jgi:hypothetical protein
MTNRIKLSNFFEPTPKKLKKLAWTLKGFFGTVGASITSISTIGVDKVDVIKIYIGMSCMIFAALCDVFIELLTTTKEDEL